MTNTDQRLQKIFIRRFCNLLINQGLRAGELLESFDRVNRVTYFLLNFSGALTGPSEN